MAWRKKEGERVRAGEVIAEIEADKATVDLEAPGDGTLARILVPAGAEKVEVGRVLAVVDEIGQMASASIEQPIDAPPRLSNRDEPRPAQSAAAITSLARSVARQAGLELFSLQGSGPEGRVNLTDVIKVLGLQSKSAGAPPPPAAAGQGSRKPHRLMLRMLRSPTPGSVRSSPDGWAHRSGRSPTSTSKRVAGLMHCSG